MKKFLPLVQAIFFMGFISSLIMTGIMLMSNHSGSLDSFGYQKPLYDGKEDFDPSLQRLKSIDQLLMYCDSIYKTEATNTGAYRFDEKYPVILSTTLRKRFYHGYSSYNYSSNFAGVLAAKFSIKTLTAIVVPDDILNYSFAACSQQAIVFMEALTRKGFSTRKVGFTGKTYGHFCGEAFYNGSWHFFDTDMEPDVEVLKQYNRPTAEFLASHPDILLKAYRRYSPEKILDIFSNFSYGSANTFPAPKAIVFQRFTKFLSYTLWLFFAIAFFLVRRKYLSLTQSHVRHSRILFPKLQGKGAPLYNPNSPA